VESLSNKDYFLFMDFRESLTLVILQSGLNTLYLQWKALSINGRRWVMASRELWLSWFPDAIVWLADDLFQPDKRHNCA
jgi:hypothetical protein